MSPRLLKKLIQEIHHRSLWQVLLIYVGAAWACFELIATVADTMGLPGWLPGLAIVLFLLGLPFVVATACVREDVAPPTEGAPATEAVSAEAERQAAVQRRRFLTWRNAGLSFLVAFALWGVVATGWLLIGERATPEEVDARKSIAVLPLENLSREEATEPFTDGIHDDILTHLYKIGELKVISRTSVLEYRDTRKNLRQIADELGVATILEGGVQRAGNRIRINVQLIDAETDEHLWAETYEEDLTAENIFAIQTDIAQRIAVALKAQLTPDERQRIEARPTDNLEAYEYYLKSKEATGAMVEEMLERAIALDPDFALAYAELSLHHMRLFRNTDMSAERLALAKESADKALEITPGLAVAHLALGQYHYSGHNDYERALAQFTIALESAPGDEIIHTWIGYSQRRLGRFEAALTSFETAARLEPAPVSLTP